MAGERVAERARPVCRFEIERVENPRDVERREVADHELELIRWGTAARLAHEAAFPFAIEHAARVALRRIVDDARPERSPQPLRTQERDASVFARELVASCAGAEPRQRRECMLDRDQLAPRIAALAQPVREDQIVIEVVGILGDRGEELGHRQRECLVALDLGPAVGQQLLALAIGIPLRFARRARERVERYLAAAAASLEHPHAARAPVSWRALASVAAASPSAASRASANTRRACGSSISLPSTRRAITTRPISWCSRSLIGNCNTS